MLTENENQNLIEDESYPSVVDAGETEEVDRALNNVYKVVDEEVTDDFWHEELAMIPSQIQRGPATVDDAKWIIREVQNRVEESREINKACEESLEFLGE